MNDNRCCKTCRHFAIEDKSMNNLCCVWKDDISPVRECRSEYLDFGCEYWKPRQKHRIWAAATVIEKITFSASMNRVQTGKERRNSVFSLPEFIRLIVKSLIEALAPLKMIIIYKIKPNPELDEGTSYSWSILEVHHGKIYVSYLRRRSGEVLGSLQPCGKWSRHFLKRSGRWWKRKTGAGTVYLCWLRQPRNRPWLHVLSRKYLTIPLYLPSTRQELHCSCLF